MSNWSIPATAAMSGEYSNGWGVGQDKDKDKVQAYMWFILAGLKTSGAGTKLFDMLEHRWLGLDDWSSLGEVTAKKVAEAREEVAGELELSAAQIAEAERLAREWKAKTWEELQAGEASSGATPSP